MSGYDSAKNPFQLDCGDSSCRYAKAKGGMRTNGGCRCARINDATAIERYWRWELCCVVQRIENLQQEALAQINLAQENWDTHESVRVAFDTLRECVAEVFRGGGE